MTLNRVSGQFAPHSVQIMDHRCQTGPSHHITSLTGRCQDCGSCLPCKSLQPSPISPWAQPPLHGHGKVGSAEPSKTNFSFMFKCLSKLQTSGTCLRVGQCPVLPTMNPASGPVFCTSPLPSPVSLTFCRQSGHKGKQGERAGFVAVSCVSSVDVTVVLEQREF